MEGYSKKPLWKKLGIKEDYTCFLFKTPDNYFELLESLPNGSEFTDEPTLAPYDFLHVFVTNLSTLKANWDFWKTNMKKDGSLWVSWPKGSSAIPTDLNGNVVRKFGLEGGLVDVKVCAVDKDWSGLKFMYRRTDR